jgi:hypothetical protein
LVLEFIGHRIAEHEQIRLVVCHDVLNERMMTRFPVQALLNIRFFADDACF